MKFDHKSQANSINAAKAWHNTTRHGKMVSKVKNVLHMVRIIIANMIHGFHSLDAFWLRAFNFNLAHSSVV